MLSNHEYVRSSLEINLFFLRIAKEHAIFAAASLPPRDEAVRKQLIQFKDTFEHLLNRTVKFSKGVISPEVTNSGELVTELTLTAETQTEFLTGIPINTNITRKEQELKPAVKPEYNQQLENEISELNREVIAGLKSVIAFKTKLYNDIANCRAFSYTYPLMLDHVLRESRFFLALIVRLQERHTLGSVTELMEIQINWNRIMGEHAKFIRGYLDPSEVQLFRTADRFALQFDQLALKTAEAKGNPASMPSIIKESLKDVTELRDFKKQGTQGLLSCKIKAIMAPLLADHVTREANHYLRLLRMFNGIK